MRINNALWPTGGAARVHTDGFVVGTELDLYAVVRKIGDQIVENGLLVGVVKVYEYLPCVGGIRIVLGKSLKLAAKKAVITTITADDIPELDRGRIGDPGSPTKVPRMFPPVMPEPGIIIDEGSVEASVKKLMQLIKD